MRGGVWRSASRTLCFLTVLSSGVFLTASSARAISADSGAINVSATVPSGLTLEMRIVDQKDNAERPSLNFGELLRTDDDFRAPTFYKVFLTVSGAGDPFELTQTGTLLTRNDGAQTLPPGAYFVKPLYEESSNSGVELPLGSQVGRTGSAVGSRVLYTDPTGSFRVITAVYTLTGDPATEATERIPLSQKSGIYSGTIQFTLTTA